MRESNKLNLPSLLDKYRKDQLFIIAEAGTNHQGDMAKAKAFIDLAAKSGCSAIKFQHVIADEILHPLTGLVHLPGGTVSLYKKFKALEQPKKFFEELIKDCRRQNILFLCSPFGFQSLRDLEDLGVEAYKVASPESNYYLLHDQLKTYKKSIFISTGVSTKKDVFDLISTYKDHRDYCLLHCVTHYPALEKEYNLMTLLSYKKWFGGQVGISDHTLDPFFIPQVSHYLSLKLQGLFILEKHITLNPGGEGLDDAIAIDKHQLTEMINILKNQAKTIFKKPSHWNKEELKTLENMETEHFLTWKMDFVKEISANLKLEKKRIDEALGSRGKHLTAYEKNIYLTTNRSLRAVTDIRKGEKITWDNVRYLRSEKNLTPGLDNSHYKKIPGLVAKSFIANGLEISWKHIRTE